MLWFGVNCHCFPIWARKLEGQLNTYQRWREAENGDTMSRDKREGLKGREGWISSPSHAQILRHAAQSRSREGSGGCHGMTRVDPKQPPALSPLRGREATEVGDGKREGRREKRNWNSLLTVCLFHRCLLFGVYSKKAALPQAGGQAPSGTGRVRAPGHHPSLTSPAPLCKDHTIQLEDKAPVFGE